MMQWVNPSAKESEESMWVWVVRIGIGGMLLMMFYAQENPCSYWNWFGYECSAEPECTTQISGGQCEIWP